MQLVKTNPQETAVAWEDEYGKCPDCDCPMNMYHGSEGICTWLCPECGELWRAED